MTRPWKILFIKSIFDIFYKTYKIKKRINTIKIN